ADLARHLGRADRPAGRHPDRPDGPAVGREREPQPAELGLLPPGREGRQRPSRRGPRCPERDNEAMMRVAELVRNAYFVLRKAYCVGTPPDTQYASRNTRYVRRRGVVLAVILWLMVVLVVVAMGLAYDTQVSARAVLNTDNQARAYYAALSGIERLC